MKARVDCISARDLFKSVFHSSNLFSSVFYPVLIYAWACRIRLYFTIYDAARADAPILGFLPSQASKIALGAGFFSDCIYAFASALGISMICAGVDRARIISSNSGKRLLKNAILIVSFLFISIIFCLQYSLIVYLHTGLTRRLLTYAARGFSPGWYLSFVSPYDIVFLLLSFTIYFLLILIPDVPRVGIRSAVLLGIATSAILFAISERQAHQRNQLLQAIFGGLNRGTVSRKLAPEISNNPLRWVGQHVVLASSSNLDRPARLPMMVQRQTVGFVDPAFALSSVIERPTQREQGENWNVILFLLESINSKYAIGSPEQPSLMPFINQLASKGLVLENHFSAGIDTDYATFPIFTGIYPMPSEIDFEDRTDLRLPTVFSVVGPRYSNTFVTESDTTLYYPIHLLLNTGLRELWDAKNLPTQSYHLFVSTFKDPSETADFFTKRANSMPEPFIAVYNLYATHSPYFDYDAKGAFAAPKNPRQRFQKDVALVDSQIKAVMDRLTASGRADRTIVVITSDHGEAFGEHPDDYGHGLHLYNTTTHVPMLFYQPKLLNSGSISEVTSHVDLLPTLLDLMGVKYDPLQFQGESVIRTLRRKYVFIYGPKHDAVASISRHRVKVIVDLHSDDCSAYDLKTDPDEMKPANCSAYQQQIDDLLEYRNHQLHFLPNYAASCQQALPCSANKAY